MNCHLLEDYVSEAWSKQVLHKSMVVCRGCWKYIAATIPTNSYDLDPPHKQLLFRQWDIIISYCVLVVCTDTKLARLSPALLRELARECSPCEATPIISLQSQILFSLCGKAVRVSCTLLHCTVVQHTLVLPTWFRQSHNYDEWSSYTCMQLYTYTPLRRLHGYFNLIMVISVAHLFSQHWMGVSRSCKVGRNMREN